MIYLSLFHGIGAVDIAWLPLGWKCAAYAEIEPFPISVTKHHHPDIPNLGDVSKITDEQIAALGPIDLVVGGSPCQDLSVAGKRAGLEGARSGLFHEQMRIFHAARTLCGARWLLWENVPGAFLSNRGRDFGIVVGAMAGAELAVPGDGWGTCGAAIGKNGLVEWRVLDAQYVRVESHPAAVPQRRRRVFALLDSGAWRDRPPVLLEPEGLHGHPAPRRETGERSPRSPARGVDCRKPFRATDGGIAEVCGTLSDGAHMGGGLNGQDAYTGRIIPVAPIPFDTTQVTSVANRCAPRAGDPSHPLAAHAHAPAPAIAFDTYNQDLTGEVTHALRDGNSEGTPAVLAVAFTTEQTPKFGGEVALTITKQSPTGGGQIQAVAIPINADALRGEVAPTLAFKPGQSEAAGGAFVTEEFAPTLQGQNNGSTAVPAIAFKASHFTRGKDDAPDNVTPPLSADADKGDQDTLVAAPVGFDEVADPVAANQARTYTREGTNNFRVSNVAISAMQVRRLTPRECERLQGFPDDYTAITVRGKPAADGPRYRALGNSMAVNVMRWIGERIAAVAQAQRERDAA